MNKMKLNRYILSLLAISAWLLANAAGARVTMEDLPYLCDFEDAAENANWVLNPKIEQITTNNAWVIGDATAYTGKKSMYVSQDGGISNTYASTNNVLIAYRDITLDAGDYDIAYDWIGMGNKTKGYLKIVYANRPTSGIKCLGNNAEPTWVASAVQLMGSNTTLCDGDAWRHVQARITVPTAQANKTTTRLFFVWVNTDVTVKEAPTSVAIDNFQLAKASSTDYPSNLHVSTMLNQATISWDGQADSYEVRYRKKSDSEFTSVQAEGKTVTLTDVEYGAYEFWICSINGEDKTIYSVFPTIYVYETDCFDALNMYNAEFEYGGWKYTNNTGLTKTVQGTERVDYGPQDKRSRHTTHFDPNEIDPRTVIKSGPDTVACLHTVPNGDFGSVRLGNWLTGSEYESMTFHYTVESQQMAVLLIHYAIVLENPDHRDTEQPRFTLDILDEAGEPIDIECASVDFHAPTPAEWERPETREIWHSSTWESHAVTWQDWRTIGISVDAYVGQTLTINLTSYDCDQGGHFGYAYFTLNCVRSDVDGLPWGEGSSTRMFTAPEGFNYAWFNREDEAFADTIRNTNPAIYPYIEENGRYFYVQESDTNTYLCHVTYPTNAECGYWFDASGKPHTPRAELDWRWTPENCTNGFVWYNRCHVVLTNQLTGAEEHCYDKQIKDCFLLLDDGSELPIGYSDEGTFVPVANKGDTIRYGVCTAVYNNSHVYADTAWYEWPIPAIGPLETHLYDTICRGESLVFPAGSHTKLTDAGDYTDPLTSLVTGCDSTVWMHLWVHEPIMAEVYDTICPGDSYNFNGRTLTSSGKQTAVVTSMVTGCDSIVTLWLTVPPRPHSELADTHLCGDERMIVRTSNSEYVDSIRVVVDTTINYVAPLYRKAGAEANVPLSNREVGERTAIIYAYMPWGQKAYTDTLQFDVSLSAGIVEARFNNVLAFLSPEYNGGMSFLGFQWFVNGEPIEGATGSWYYEPTLDPQKEFTVEVTLEDGSKVWTCPFTFDSLSRAQDTELVTDTRTNGRKVLRNGQLIIITNEREYTAQGIVLK